MNTYRKKNYRGKRNYSGRPHRRTVDNYHQPMPPERDWIPCNRHTLTKPDVEAVVDALLSGSLAGGRELERFESLLGKLTHSDHAIAMNSGTAALHAGLACLKLEPGDEVITSTLNHPAAANMIRGTGATAILADCDPNTLALSVAAAKAAITPQTKAILTNNFGGHPSDLYALRELCDEFSLVLVEDASHGLGGKYRGHYVGNQADITCFSFDPAMAITTCNGGAVTTSNRAIASWIRQFRDHGIQTEARHFQAGQRMPAYYQELQFAGMDYVLSELHAALGRSQLTRLDRHIERRRSIAQVYYQKLGAIEELVLPYVAEWADNAFHLFPIQLSEDLEDKRDQIFDAFRAQNIKVKVHYVPLHRMPLFSGADPAQFPRAEAYYRRCLSLPLYPDLSYKEIERITELLIKLVNKHKPEVAVADVAQDEAAAADAGEAVAEAAHAGETASGNAEDGGHQGGATAKTEISDDADAGQQAAAPVVEQDTQAAEGVTQAWPEAAEPAPAPAAESASPWEAVSLGDSLAMSEAPLDAPPNQVEALALEPVADVAVPGGGSEADAGPGAESAKEAAPAKKARGRQKRTSSRLRKIPKESAEDTVQKEDASEDAPAKKPKKKTTRTRTTRKPKAAAKPAEGTEAAESKPARTRTTRRRTVKKAADAAPEGEVAEKPKRPRRTRTRRTKKDEAAESTGDAVQKPADPSGEGNA